MIMKGQSKYTDRDLIEWQLSIDTNLGLRTDSVSKHQIAYKRKLNMFFPEKGKHRKWSNEEIDEIIAMSIEERKEYISKKKSASEPEAVKDPKTLFVPAELEDGTILCSRCLKELSMLSKGTKVMCRPCMNACYKFTFRGEDMNPWNVRDPFIHSTIRHHEKSFHLGMIADEKTQKYLTAVGYGFVFKELYKEVKDQ